MMRACLSVLVGALFAVPAAAQNPYTTPDDTWITLSGTVDIVQPSSFTLDYGDGVVTVEMDDWTPGDSLAIAQGDSVTVTGLIDDDFFQTTTVEASSVYAQNANSYYFASPADEEDAFVTVISPIEVSSTTLQGRITDIEGSEITLDSGDRMVTVDLSDLPYDPLDDEGSQKLEVGDRVSVNGTLDANFFEGRQLTADWIVTLSNTQSS